LLCIGLVAVSGWLIAGHLLLKKQFQRTLLMTVLLTYAVYAIVVLRYSQTFITAIAFYVPATLLMLAAFVHKFRQERANRLRDAVAGILLSLVAAGIQKAKIDIHPQYFNHNALYHLVQAIALYLIYRGAMWCAVREAE
jgi:hypothetical protein